MTTIPIPLPHTPYEVQIGTGILSSCGKSIRAACGEGRCVLITDSNVAPLYAETVERSLADAGIRVACTLVVPAGEASKSLSQAESLCNALVGAGLDRSSFLVALGGGVVGDLAGFVAAIYYRGIPFCQIPTTLLAQVDSSVGGKTGVNIAAGKNLVGSFHQPRLVIADTATLAPLPRREFAEGMAEIIKHGAIADPSLVDEAVELSRRDRKTLVARNVAIKADVVVSDEHETRGRRVFLNFGHTLGHALELLAGYGSLLHGEAVALGMVAALELSVARTGLPRSEADRVLAALRDAGLPTYLGRDDEDNGDNGDARDVSCKCAQRFEADTLISAMSSDKKFAAGKRNFVLLERLGKPVVCDCITDADIKAALT